MLFYFDRRAKYSLRADVVNFKTLKHLKKLINIIYSSLYCTSIFVFANNEIDQDL